MATIITRQVGYVGSQTQTAKGTPLTNAEIDQNFINLNVNKVELNGSGAALTALNASNISTGTLAVARGGSGQTTYTNGQLLIGNTSGNTLTKATLTAGTNIAVTNGNGSISIATSATPSFTTVTTSGNVTLSGDIAVNGGDLTTTASTFNLLVSNAATLNIGQASTSLSIGATTGTTTIRNSTLAVTNALTVGTTLAITGVASFAAGSAAAPSITRTGDTNTGIYFPTADTMAFVEGGVEAMRINSSGNVGIGVTDPAEKIDVAGNIFVRGGGGEGGQVSLFENTNQNVGAFIDIDSANSFRILNAQNTDTIFYTNTTERLRILANGNIGVATSNPDVKLDITGGNVTVRGDGTNAYLSLRDTFNSGYMAYFGGTSSLDMTNVLNGPVKFSTNNTVRMTVHGSGGVSIGNTTNSGLSSLNVSGSISGGYNEVSPGATAIGFGTDNVVRTTPTANVTYTTTVPAAGAICVLSILTSGTVSRIITFGTGFRATGTLATGTVSARYFNVTFVSDGTNLIEMSRTVAIA